MFLKKARWLIPALCVIIVMISGCSKVNQENYKKLKMGMDYKAVIVILGEPGKCDDVLNAKSCTWGDERKNINIKFVVDKVVFYKSTGL